MGEVISDRDLRHFDKIWIIVHSTNRMVNNNIFYFWQPPFSFFKYRVANSWFFFAPFIKILIVIKLRYIVCDWKIIYQIWMSNGDWQQMVGKMYRNVSKCLVVPREKPKVKCLATSDNGKFYSTLFQCIYFFFQLLTHNMMMSIANLYIFEWSRIFANSYRLALFDSNHLFKLFFSLSSFKF